MAFTREELQAYIDDRIDSPTAYSCGTVRELCRALLAEMDKQKDDVWKDAPNNATKASVCYHTNISGYIGQKTYTRELPKSRAREIAEEAWRSFRDRKVGNGEDYITSLEDAILKREKELEAGK
jgi:hypothetical protein